MTVELVGKPSEKDYMWLKECAYGTFGKEVKTPVESDWLYRILRARQDAPVTVRASLNAEALMNIANKRLCKKAAKETMELVYMMCQLAVNATPELEDFLVPACEYHGGNCHEMKPCYEDR